MAREDRVPQDLVLELERARSRTVLRGRVEGPGSRREGCLVDPEPSEGSGRHF